MRIFFCRIGWAKHYRGDKDDIPRNGGSYNDNPQNIGFETYNFKNYANSYYGYVKNKREWSIHIERIEPCLKSQDYLDDVLVIWVATKDSGGEYIVGWYKNATVYRKYHTVPESVKKERIAEHNIYNIFTKEAVLLDEKDRTCQIFGIGQFNYWFDEENAEKEKVLKFIGEYETKQK